MKFLNLNSDMHNAVPAVSEDIALHFGSSHFSVKPYFKQLNVEGKPQNLKMINCTIQVKHCSYLQCNGLAVKTLIRIIHSFEF